MPQMLEQHLGQLPLGLRPLLIRFAHRHVNLEHQRPVQVVHQLHEVIARFRRSDADIAGAELAAGNVQLAALIERRSQQRHESELSRPGIAVSSHDTT